MDWILDPGVWIALLSLTAIEIVLGIDNIVFVAILASRLPQAQRRSGRLLGLAAAMVTRIALLFCITFLMRLTNPLFSLFSLEFSARDLILIAGGLFLIAKSTVEVHDNIENPHDGEHKAPGRAHGFVAVVVQIGLLDIVFSLDSVITAIGLAEDLAVMVAAIVIAVGFMMFAAGAVSRFVEEHPTVKILALSFLIMIGVALIGDGIDLHIPRGYMYFAMAFSVAVETLNLRMRRRARQ